MITQCLVKRLCSHLLLTISVPAPLSFSSPAKMSHLPNGHPETREGIHHKDRQGVHEVSGRRYLSSFTSRHQRDACAFVFLTLIFVMAVPFSSASSSSTTSSSFSNTTPIYILRLRQSRTFRPPTKNTNSILNECHSAQSPPSAVLRAFP